MRFFKYLIFFLIFPSSFSFAAYTWTTEGYGAYSTPSAACSAFASTLGVQSASVSRVSDTLYKCNIGGSLFDTNRSGTLVCPSAKLIEVRVPVNAQKYQCFSGCQYGTTKCVDLNIQEGMACDAISTGVECGTAPPKPPKDPNDNSVTPDAPTDTPSAPGQNPSGTNTNSATSSGTSTSTSTTTNNTTTTTTTTNITTKLDLSSLESTINSVGAVLGEKLDAIKKNGEDLNNWLQGKNSDGTGGGVGDNPFGTDETPEKELDKKNFSTSIFGSNAQCPSDKTLSMTLFTGRTFTKTFSYSMWCDKLAIFGQFILIASYLYGAYIVTRNS